MRCPRCGAEIDHLEAEAQVVGTIVGKYFLPNGEEEWDEKSLSNWEIEDVKYFCPVCGEEVDPNEIKE